MYNVSHYSPDQLNYWSGRSGCQLRRNFFSQLAASSSNAFRAGSPHAKLTRALRSLDPVHISDFSQTSRDRTQLLNISQCNDSYTTNIHLSQEPPVQNISPSIYLNCACVHRTLCPAFSLSYDMQAVALCSSDNTDLSTRALDASAN